MIERADSTKPIAAGLRLLVALVVVALTAALIFALVASGDAAPGLQAAATAQLPQSGVENPVTAVLLNFRGFDTLLEIAILLLVTVAMLPEKLTQTSPRNRVDALAEHHQHSAFINETVATTKGRDTSAAPDRVLINLVKLLVPVTVLMSAYLLWIGAYAPGGAFQAGALLAGSGVLLSLTNHYQFSFNHWHAKYLLVGGLLLFVIVAVAMVFVTDVFFQYPPASAGIMILLIESALTLSIATTLLLLYNNLANPEPRINQGPTT